MKILHINGTVKGGVFNGIKNIHVKLNEKNIKSFLLLPKKIDLINVIGLEGYFYNLIQFFKRKFTRLISKLFLNSYQSMSLGLFKSNKIQDLIKKINPDIVHIHWIGNEFMSVDQINDINQKIFITLHDMWMALPYQHYSLKKPKIDNFLVKKLKEFLIKKKKQLDNKNISFLVTSDWMKKKIIEKKFYPNSKVIKIPYGLDFSEWKIYDKRKCKEELGFDTNKKTLLFTAFGINNKRKGLNILLRALEYSDFNYQLVIASDNKPTNFHYKNIIFYKDTNSEMDRIKLYNACDILLAPSIQEAFGLVALEALSCNIPCVGFKNTGFTETIIHKTNGYLADYLDPIDFGKGINWINNELDNNPLKFNNIRTDIKNRFCINKIVNQYIHLYSNDYKKET